MPSDGVSTQFGGWVVELMDSPQLHVLRKSDGAWHLVDSGKSRVVAAGPDKYLKVRTRWDIFIVSGPGSKCKAMQNTNSLPGMYLLFQVN